MKKIIPLLLAMALLLSLGSAALAGDTGDSHTYAPDDSATMEQTITTNIPDNKITWYLEIPADCTINASLTHTGNFTLKTDESKKIPFTLNAFDEDVAAGTPVIVSQYWSDTRNNNCYAEFNIVISRDSWKSAEAGGNYTTPVTYTSELVDHIVDPADGGTDRG